MTKKPRSHQSRRRAVPPVGYFDLLKLLSSGFEEEEDDDFERRACFVVDASEAVKLEQLNCTGSMSLLCDAA